MLRMLRLVTLCGLLASTACVDDPGPMTHTIPGAAHRETVTGHGPRIPQPDACDLYTAHGPDPADDCCAQALGCVPATAACEAPPGECYDLACRFDDGTVHVVPGPCTSGL